MGIMPLSLGNIVTAAEYRVRPVELGSGPEALPHPERSRGASE